MASIPTSDFKSFFSVTLVQQRYPRLSYQLAQQKKNQFCNLTLQYLGRLQGYMKNYDIDNSIERTINNI